MSKPFSVTAKPIATPLPVPIKKTGPGFVKATTQRSFLYLPYCTVVSILPRVSKTIKQWAEEDSFWTPQAKKEFSKRFTLVVQMPLDTRGSLKSLMTTTLQIYIYLRKNFLQIDLRKDPIHRDLNAMQSENLEDYLGSLQLWMKDYVANKATKEVSQLAKFNESCPIMSLWEISGRALRSPKLLNSFLELTPTTRLAKPELIELGRNYDRAKARIPALMEKAKKLAPALNDSLTVRNLKLLKDLLELPAAIVCTQVFQLDIRYKVFEIQDLALDEIENLSSRADLF